MFSALCPICNRPKHGELFFEGKCLDKICACPEVGDVLINTSSHALARKIRVTEVTAAHFMADVLEGDNTQEPLQVFRPGWFLYQKTTQQN